MDEECTFRGVSELPRYDNHFLVQYENGHYEEMFYWAVSEDTLLSWFKGDRVTGPVVRWCYIDDLNRVS